MRLQSRRSLCCTFPQDVAHRRPSLDHARPHQVPPPCHARPRLGRLLLLRRPRPCHARPRPGLPRLLRPPGSHTSRPRSARSRYRRVPHAALHLASHHSRRMPSPTSTRVGTRWLLPQRHPPSPVVEAPPAPLPRVAVAVQLVTNQHSMVTRAKQGFRVPALFHATPLSPCPRPSVAPSPIELAGCYGRGTHRPSAEQHLGSRTSTTVGERGHGQVDLQAQVPCRRDT